MTSIINKLGAKINQINRIKTNSQNYKKQKTDWLSRVKTYDYAKGSDSFLLIPRLFGSGERALAAGRCECRIKNQCPNWCQCNVQCRCVDNGKSDLA